MSSKRSSESQGESPKTKRQAAESVSEGGSKGGGRRRVALLAKGPAPARKKITADVAVGPPTLGEVDKAHPLPEGLTFDWGEFARRRITVGELRSIAEPRPDVKRLLKVASVVDDGAGRISGWLGRQAVYVVPAGLPCAVTFVRSLDEVLYIDAAARVLFVEKAVDEFETPMSLVKAFSRFPFDYHRDAASVKRWKAAAGVRRTLNALVDERDWAVVCQRGTDASVFNHWAGFVEGVTPSDFARVPELFAKHDVSAGVVVPVPWALRFFAAVVEDCDDDDVRYGIQRWSESEWASFVIEAYGFELYERGTAWVMSVETIVWLEGFAKVFEPLSVGTISINSDKFDWTLVVDIMGRAADQAVVARRWNDFCTNRSFGFVGFDVRTGELRDTAGAGPSSRGVQGGDRGRSSRDTVVPRSFGGGVLYGVLTSDDLKLIGGIDEAMGVEVAKRSEQERRVGDVLVDFVGVVNRLRRRVGSLDDRVKTLEREVEEREAEVRRLQSSQYRSSSVAGPPDPYAADNTYARGDGQRWGSYNRSMGTQPDPYAEPSSYGPPDPYRDQRTYVPPAEGRRGTGGRAAAASNVGDNAGGAGDNRGFRQVRRRYPTLAGGVGAGRKEARDDDEGRDNDGPSGFGTGLGEER